MSNLEQRSSSHPKPPSSLVLVSKFAGNCSQDFFRSLEKIVALFSTTLACCFWRVAPGLLPAAPGHLRETVPRIFFEAWKKSWRYFALPWPAVSGGLLLGCFQAAPGPLLSCSWAAPGHLRETVPKIFFEAWKKSWCSFPLPWPAVCGGPRVASKLLLGRS